MVQMLKKIYKCINHFEKYWNTSIQTKIQGLQKAEGLFGGFVVRKPREDEFYKDLYDEDLPEHLIVVHDWTHESSVEKYIAHYQGSGDNNPDTILINGKGMFRSFKRNHKKYYTPVTKFTVKQVSGLNESSFFQIFVTIFCKGLLTSAFPKGSDYHFSFLEM